MHVSDFRKATSECARWRGYSPSLRNRFGASSLDGDWVLLQPELYTPDPETDGGLMLPPQRFGRGASPPPVNEVDDAKDGGKRLASYMTPANIAKYGAENLFGTRPPGGARPAAMPRLGAMGKFKLGAPRLGWR